MTCNSLLICFCTSTYKLYLLFWFLTALLCHHSGPDCGHNLLPDRLNSPVWHPEQVWLITYHILSLVPFHTHHRLYHPFKIHHHPYTVTDTPSLILLQIHHHSYRYRYTITHTVTDTPSLIPLQIHHHSHLTDTPSLIPLQIHHHSYRYRYTITHTLQIHHHSYYPRYVITRARYITCSIPQNMSHN